MGTNTYYRLWNSSDILETDAEAQERMVPYSKITEDIFGGRDIKITSVHAAGDSHLIRVSYLNKIFKLLVVNLKNSGMQEEIYRYRKRFQISASISDVQYGESLYALGAYNAGDKTIYISTDITQFYQSAKNGNSYSSLWLQYDELKKCYQNNSNEWRDNKSRFFSGMTSTYVKQLSDAELVDRLFASTGIYPRTRIVVGDDEVSVDIDAPSPREANIRLMPRNQNLRRQAIQRENYTCELCGCKKTFETTENEQYFEGHHLIMYNQEVQKRYKVSLDNIDNIVCLCPNCHREIHHASDEIKKNDVVKLLQRHKKLYEIYEIETAADIQAIINDYINNVSDSGGDDDE